MNKVLDKRVIVVSGTLPVHSREDGTSVLAPSYASVAASILYGVEEEGQKSTIFVGTPQVKGMPLYKNMPSSPFTFIPVHTKQHPYRLSFSKHISRACHHALGKSALFPSDLDEPYKEYLEFNKTFLSALQNIYREGDTIIVTGKHLLILPKLLREAFPDAYIVTLFLSPFPAYELFSCVPYSKEVIYSLLSSNRVEFQAEEYTENFICTSFSLVNAQNREISSEMLSSFATSPFSEKLAPKTTGDTDTKNRAARVLQNQEKETLSSLSWPFPAGEEALFAEKLEISSVISPVETSFCPEEYLKDTASLLEQQRKTRTARKYIVYAGELRCFVCTSLPYAPKEFLMGVQHTEMYKQAFEALSTATKGRKVVLIVESTREVGSSLLFVQTASWYLKKYGNAPVDFIRCVVCGESSSIPNITLAGIAGTLSAIFPGRIHTVLFPSVYKYLALLMRADVCMAGSECDAFSLVLNEYLSINPKKVAVTLFSSGISISGVHYSSNCSYVMAEVLQKALNAEDPVEKGTSQIESLSVWLEQICSLPFFLGSNASCKSLDSSDIEEIKKSYALAKERVVMLDYDGTLAEIVPNPRDACPTKEILSLLSDLVADKCNRVVLITGRGREEAEEWFSISGLTIYAEHGAYKKENDKWEKTACDLSWMPEAIKIIEKYVTYTPRSNIEIKNTCVVFHCGEYGRWCANALQKMLYGRARVVTGRGIVEVRPLSVDKGACASIEHKKGCFALCAGDDLTDEDMFMVLKKEPETHCICVGERKTCAPHRIDSPSSLRRLLRALLDSSKRQ